MTYKFTHDGKEFEIPAMKDIEAGVIRKSRKAAKDEEDRVFIILETLLGEDSPELAALDKMSATDFGKVIRGWSGGATLGE
jgi:hypothetical protein